MKKRILVTHIDFGSTPEILDVEGKTEKELIFKCCIESEYIYLIDDKICDLTDKFGNDELSKEEFIKEIKFEKLEEFLNHLDNITSESFFRIID